METFGGFGFVLCFWWRSKTRSYSVGWIVVPKIVGLKPVSKLNQKQYKSKASKIEQQSSHMFWWSSLQGCDCWGIMNKKQSYLETRTCFVSRNTKDRLWEQNCNIRHCLCSSVYTSGSGIFLSAKFFPVTTHSAIIAYKLRAEFPEVKSSHLWSEFLAFFAKAQPGKLSEVLFTTYFLSKNLLDHSLLKGFQKGPIKVLVWAVFL